MLKGDTKGKTGRRIEGRSTAHISPHQHGKEGTDAASNLVATRAAEAKRNNGSRACAVHRQSRAQGSLHRVGRARGLAGQCERWAGATLGVGYAGWGDR